MAYEDVTFEVILQRMLDRVPDHYDKRESSVIYNALAPAAIELQLMYIEFDIILGDTFGDTASREYLIRRAAERGLEPYPATYAIIKGKFTPEDLEVPVGSRFSLGDNNYAVTEKVSPGEYKLKSEQPGEIGNEIHDRLIPIDYIEGLETAHAQEVIIPGEEEEETERLRDRYFETFDTKAFGGNRKDYISKTNAIQGVGATKVTPIWQGGGTVKLTILNSEFRKASTSLIAEVQKTIDPTKDGQGLGIAPIGHIVTVESVKEVPINVNLTLAMTEGYYFQTIKDSIEKVIDEYLAGLRKSWEDDPQTVIRVAPLNTAILNKVDGITDIIETKINGRAENLMLNQGEIPIMGVLAHD